MPEGPSPNPSAPSGVPEGPFPERRRRRPLASKLRPPPSSAVCQAPILDVTVPLDSSLSPSPVLDVTVLDVTVPLDSSLSVS